MQPDNRPQPLEIKGAPHVLPAQLLQQRPQQRIVAQEERDALATEQKQFARGQKRFRGLMMIGLGLGLAGGFVGGAAITAAALAWGSLKGVAGGAVAGGAINLALIPRQSAERRRVLSDAFLIARWNALIELGVVDRVQQGPSHYKDARGVRYNFNQQNADEFISLCQEWIRKNEAYVQINQASRKGEEQRKERQPSGKWIFLEGDTPLSITVNRLLEPSFDLAEARGTVEGLATELKEVSQNPQYVPPVDVGQVGELLGAAAGSSYLAGHELEDALINEYEAVLARTHVVDRTSLVKVTEDLRRQQNISNQRHDKNEQTIEQMQRALQQKDKEHQREKESIDQRFAQLERLLAGRPGPAAGEEAVAASHNIATHCNSVSIPSNGNTSTAEEKVSVWLAEQRSVFMPSYQSAADAAEAAYAEDREAKLQNREPSASNSSISFLRL